MYPIYLKLSGSSVAVIGAGAVAERKIQPLLDAGAHVTVVAPDATDGIRQLAEDGAVVWKRRPFRRSDMKHQTLVITATSDVAVNAKVYALASRRRQLVNSVDDPAHCSFYVPAMVRRDPLLVAISTSGRAPLFAKRLQRFLDKKLYPGIGTEVEQLGKIRDAVLAESSGLEQADRSRRVSEAQATAVQSILDTIERA